MAKHQTRRSVSLSKSAYDRLRIHCNARGIAVSAFVQAAAEEAMANDVKLGTAVARNERRTSNPATALGHE